MRSIWILIKLYLNSIYRFQVVRHSKDPRERRNAVMSIAAVFLVAIVYGGLSGMTTYRMLSAGIDASVPMLMLAMMASLFALAMAFAQGSATLSGFADFDTLMSMPIKTSRIVLARFMALYLSEAVYCLAYLLPCGAVYAIFGSPAWWFYPVFPLLVLLLPVVPVVLGSGLDLLISAAFAKSKHKKGITTAIKMILLLAFVVVAYLSPQLSSRFFADPAKMSGIASRIYPPAEWFGKGVTGSAPLALLFGGGSVVLCALFVLILNKTFLPLHDRLTASYHVRNYRLPALKRSSAAKAMFLIERKRFFNSTAWVVNTIFGPVLIAVLGVAAAALSGVLTALFRTIGLVQIVPAIFIGLLTFCATVTPTTCCAISMEGKEIWISKTLPVSARIWLRAKLLVNLMLVGPSLLFAIAMLTVFYRNLLGAAGILGVVLLPIASLLFTTVFGLYVNAKMPRLTWKADIEVVKQSGAVLIMLLVGFGLIALSVLPTLLFGIGWLPAAVAAAILGASAAVYLYLMKNAERIRENL